jgi:hypothetical protein
MERLLTNIFLLHVSILTYIFMKFYIFIESNDSSNYINNYIVFNNKTELIMFIKLKLKNILIEQIVFRVYFVELLSYFFNYDITTIIYCITLSTYHVILLNNLYIQDKTILQLNKFAHTYIITYFIMSNISPLFSLILSYYTETFSIIIQVYLYYYFPLNKTQVIDNKKNN